MSTTIAVPVSTDDRAESPYTLTEAPPRSLGFLDQFSLWGNLAISLTLPVLAPFLLTPGSSLAATVSAVLVGAVVGSFILGLTAVPGAATGAPAMVVLRGLLGAKISYLPTALNVLQCVGWAVVEILVIAQLAQQLTKPSLHGLFVVLAGVAATLLALYPLGVVKRMRKYAALVVLVASAYLFAQVIRQGIGPWDSGSWSNFWPSVDLVVALAVSWAPLASDYSRHSRSRGSAFGGAFAGYATGSALYLLLGVFALAGIASGSQDVFAALRTLPFAALALTVLVVDEVDEAFANVYSTALSVQNITPRLDRRVLAIAIGVLATAIAFVVDLTQYEVFLFAIGAVFVPLSAVLIVTFFTQRRSGWDTSQSAPARAALLVPWAVGFAVYELIAPTAIAPWWTDAWTSAQSALHFTPQPWMSASLLAFAVAALLTAITLPLARRRG